MKKTIRLLTTTLIVVLCLSLAFALVACGNDASKTSEPTNNPGGGEISGSDANLTVTDGMGRTLLINTNEINRVVCIGAGALRLYSYVADMDKLCAVENIEKTRTTERISYRAYQIANEELFLTLPSAGEGGPQAQILNKEVLITLNPDLIFSCLTLTADELADAERAIGCPIVTLKYGAQKAFSQEILDSITLIGKIMKKEARAKEVTDYMISLKADIAAKAEGLTSAKVYLACNSNWGKKGFFSTSKNYPIFTLSGITNVVDDESFALTNGMADAEAVVASNADKIILDAGGLEIFKGEYNEQGSTLPTVLDTMAAFRNKEVYLMMPNNAYDANVETYFINAYYALNVAYGLNIDIEEKANEITSFFLGQELYDDITVYGGYQKLNLPDVWPQ